MMGRRKANVKGVETDPRILAEVHEIMDGLRPVTTMVDTPPAPEPTEAPEGYFPTAAAPPPPAARRVPVSRDPLYSSYGAEPVPMEQRRIDLGGCAVCGTVSKQHHDRWTGSVFPTRMRAPGAWFGLVTVKGPSDMCSFELCKECANHWARAEGIHYEHTGMPAYAGFALTSRLRQLKRADLLGDVPPDEILPVSKVPELTWLGHVVAARVDGRPDPELPVTPFGYLDRQASNHRQKAKATS